MADARSIELPDGWADVAVTSPPYWRKRRYGVPGEIGWEDTVEEYAEAIGECLVELRRVLAPHGSVWLNIGDTYKLKSLVGAPFEVERVARRLGWKVRQRVCWGKTRGVPDPAVDRLTPRWEVVLHLTGSSYWSDLHGFTERFGRTAANPGDLWIIDPDRSKHSHLAPFPGELVERCLAFSAPREVCLACGAPRVRMTSRGADLDTSRPQARRAMELAAKHGLTPDHFAAIRATGISDAGKAAEIQTGTGRNSTQVQVLAAEAKAALGGYFREFTLGRRITTGWSDCGCSAGWRPGRVVDPFLGSGTTADVALQHGYVVHGADASHPTGEERDR